MLAISTCVLFIILSSLLHFALSNWILSSFTVLNLGFPYNAHVSSSASENISAGTSQLSCQSHTADKTSCQPAKGSYLFQIVRGYRHSLHSFYMVFTWCEVDWASAGFKICFLNLLLTQSPAVDPITL